MATTTAGDLILSIRAQIPDRVPGDDPAVDGKAFPVADLLRWINDAGRLIGLSAPVIQDWYAVPSINGQDVYDLPQHVTSVEQAWFDLLPMSRMPEGDGMLTTKTSGPSWSFSPHSIHATPRIFLWPAPNRTGASTTLNGAVSAGVTSLTLTSGTNFKSYGYLRIGGTASTAELCRYATISGTAVSNLLRGEGGTQDRAWTNGSAVDEANIVFKCFRLPVPLKTVSDPVEIPQGLWPLVELYVMSKVRGAEQDDAASLQFFQQFMMFVEKLGEKGPLKGIRQGLQVRIASPLSDLFSGRIYIP